MGQRKTPEPVVLVVAASSRYQEAIDWAAGRCVAEFGPSFHSPACDFDDTDYYTSSMGTDLRKQFLAFERLFDPAGLADVKQLTNEWEAEYATFNRHPEPRPLNLDPGYVTLAKLVLASTKDHAHRIYLRHGIYAEVTLAYRAGAWQTLPWTYPDYRRSEYHEFFTRCRDVLRRK